MSVSDPIERERLEIRARLAIGQAVAIRIAARGLDSRDMVDLVLNRDEIVRIVTDELARYFALPN
jgi:hypothetical protein